jgi:hypothetical protein
MELGFFGKATPNLFSVFLGSSACREEETVNQGISFFAQSGP